MTYLQILQLVMEYGPAVKQIIDEATTNLDIVSKIKNLSKPLADVLERVGAEGKAGPLKTYVRTGAHESTLLLPNAPRGKAVRDERWKLFVNARVEPDL